MHLPAVPTRTGADATLNFDAVVKVLDTAVKALAKTTTDSGWVAAALENVWKNTGGAFLTGAYRKQGNQVRLRGLIEGGLTETTAFTLPEGFRPTATVIAPASSGENKTGNVHIASTGIVEPHYTSVTKIISLDGIMFTTD